MALTVSENYRHGKAITGRIGTVDCWNREIDRIYWFRQQMQIKGEEMETFAAAQITEAFNIPFLSIRTISYSEVSGK